GRGAPRAGRGGKRTARGDARRAVRARRSGPPSRAGGRLGPGGRAGRPRRRCRGAPVSVTALLAPELEAAQRESLLGRTDPLLKLGIALGWLIGLGSPLDVGPPLILVVVALVAGLQLGAIPPATLARRLAPLALAALVIAATNLLFSSHNPDPAAH